MAMTGSRDHTMMDRSIPQFTPASSRTTTVMGTITIRIQVN